MVSQGPSAARSGGVPNFLELLSPADANDVLALGVRRRLPARSILFHEGDEGTACAIVTEGRLKASYWSADGREVLLNVHRPGEAVGVVSVIDGDVRTASVSALEPVDIVMVPREALLELSSQRPAVAFALMNELCHLFRTSNRKQLDFGTLDTLGRVARQLATLAESFGEAHPDGLLIDLPLTQQDLANWVGASREAAGKAMQHLERLGYVSSPRRRQVVVRDLDALRSLTG